MMLRVFSCILPVISTLFLLITTSPAVADNILDVGGRKQLFIDQKFIAHSEGIELVANPAQKLGLVRDDHGQPIYGHIGQVYEHDGKIRMHLGADSAQVWESDDGLTFKNTGVNLSGGIFPMLFVDAHDSDPARRYKLFKVEFGQPFDRAKHGVHAGYSADGVNFTWVGQVLPFFTDNPVIVDWDERLQKYVIFTRGFDYNSENQRRIARIETDDVLKPWPYQKTDKDGMFFGIQNAQIVLSADGEDDPHSDIYYNSFTRYPLAQDVQLMFTAQFRHFAPNRQPFIRPHKPGQWEDFGLLEVQMAVSRDGITWQRPTREPYFPTGLADEWDRWYAVMAPGFARRGNYLYQYYYSSGRTHDSVVLRAEYDHSAPQLGGIGAVRQRLDGFMSADADHKGGWLETPVLKFTGNQLRLNVDTGSMGTCFVELRDAEGKPIPGFTLADCEEIGGNFIDQRVYWKGNSDVSKLAGQPIRIHIRLTRGKLYAFQFTQE